MATPKRLVGPVLLGNTAVTEYTVPAGLSALIRHVHVLNVSQQDAWFILSIGADAAATRLYNCKVPGNGQPFSAFAYQPMAAGEIIQAYSSIANALALTIGGDVVAS